MLHKLRLAMGKRDAGYNLKKVIELDEDFFSTEIPEAEKSKPSKRSRGSQKKSKVFVMAESILVEAEYFLRYAARIPPELCKWALLYV